MGELLRDHVVLVSGGTQGVGAGIARAAAREGATVVVTGRRPEVGERFADEIGAAYVRADVGDVPSARASVTAVVQRYGRIDSLVNAAGLTSRATLLDTTEDLFDAHIAVNLRGPFFLMQAAVADMVRRGAPGTIVNIGSVSELGGQPYLTRRSRTRPGDGRRCRPPRSASPVRTSAGPPGRPGCRLVGARPA